MNRRSRNALIVSLLIITLLVLGQVISLRAVIYPFSSFPFQSSIGEFVLYSDAPISPEMEGVIAEVQERLVEIPLYDTGEEYLVFLCQNATLYENVAAKIGKSEQSQGLNVQPLDYTFINLTFISIVRERSNGRYKYNLLEGNLAHIVAHEITHQLIAQKLGYITTRQVENWKLEGYCEYAATLAVKKKDESYSFPEQVMKFYQGYYNEVIPMRKFYLKSQLFVEFYLDVRGNSFEDLVRGNVSEEALDQQLRELTETTPPQLLSKRHR